MSLYETKLTALDASIAHWERIVCDPTKEPHGRPSCALCTEFHNGGGCEDCPVSEHSGVQCQGSPYKTFTTVCRKHDDGEATLEDVKAAALDEVVYLKGRKVELIEAEEERLSTRTDTLDLRIECNGEKATVIDNKTRLHLITFGPDGATFHPYVSSVKGIASVGDPAKICVHNGPVE